MTNPTKVESIQQLYLAYLQRPADVVGAEFWKYMLDTVGSAGVGAELAKSSEYHALVAGKSHAEVVDTLYLNLFGRHADDSGLAFYKGVLESGKATVDMVAADILQGARGSDLDIINNKVVAAELFTTALEIDPLNIAGYATFLQKGKDYLASVTDDASLFTALGKLPDALEIIMTIKSADQAGVVARDVIATPALDNVDRVQELFLAYLDRPASVAELALWTDTLAKSSFAAVSEQLSKTAEYTSSVQGLNPAQVVDHLYMNLFGRPGEAGGLAFFGDALASGKVKVDEIVRMVLDGAQGADRQVLENRMLGAELFTTSLKIEDDLSAMYAAYTATGKAFMASIDDDASVYTALRGLPKVLHDLIDLMNTPLVLHAELVGVAASDQGFFGA